MLNTYLLGNPPMRLESNHKFIIFWMFISPNATECTLWWSMGCPLGPVPDPQTPASRFEQTRPSPVRSPPGQYGSARQSESSIALRIDWCRTFFQERFLLSPSSSHQTLEWFAMAGTFRVTSAHTHMRRGLGSVMLHFFSSPRLSALSTVLVCGQNFPFRMIYSSLFGAFHKHLCIFRSRVAFAAWAQSAVLVVLQPKKREFFIHNKLAFISSQHRPRGSKVGIRVMWIFATLAVISACLKAKALTVAFKQICH